MVNLALFSYDLIVSVIYWVDYLLSTKIDLEVSAHSVLIFSELTCSHLAPYFRCIRLDRISATLSSLQTRLFFS